VVDTELAVADQAVEAMPGLELVFVQLISNVRL